MRNRLANLDIELKIAKENVAIQENLVKQGASSRQMYLAELAKKQNIITQRESLKNKIPVVKEELKEAKKELDSFKSKRKVEFLKELRDVKISINKLLEKEKASTRQEKP
jgi:aryl carrier-like protein